MKAISATCRVFGFIAACLFLGAALVVTYETVARYLARPTIWAQDLALYLMIAGAFFSQGAVMLVDGHVRVDVFLDRMPEKLRRLLVRVTLGLSLIYVLPLIWQGAVAAWKSWEVGRMSTSLFRIPTWLPESTIPIGSALLALAIIIRILRPITREEADSEGLTEL